MIHKVLVTPIIGLPQVNGWAQVTESSEGRFVCVFSISGAQAGNVGRDLVDLIKTSPPDSATTVYALLKKAIRFVSEKDCDIQLASGFFDPEQTIFAAYNGALLLKRNGKVGSLLIADDKIKIIEGQKLDEDIFVLLTKSALEFKGDIFQKLGQGLDADTTVASIVPGVQTMPDSSLIAMAFISDWSGEVLIEADETEDQVPEFKMQSEGDLRTQDFAKNVSEDESTPETPLETDLSQEPEESILPTIEATSGNKNIKLNGSKLKQALQSILVLLKKLAKFIFVIFRQLFKLGRSLFSKDVYVNGQQNALKKKLKYIVIFILGLGLVIAPFIFLNWRSARQVQAATEVIEEDLNLYEDAKNLVKDDPIKAREDLERVIANLESKKKTFKDKSPGFKYIDEQIGSVNEFYQSVSGREEFNELDIFFDFSLVESDFIAHRADIIGNKAYFFDKDKKGVIELDLDNKSFSQIDLSGAEVINDLAYSEDDIYIADQGFSKKSLTDEDSLSKIIDEGSANRDAKAIDFFNDNIYSLSIEQRNVFKYPYDSENDEFTAPIRWVKSAKDLDFSLVADMVIDGDIWLSTREGKIFRLSAGEGEEFVIRGLNEGFSSQLTLFTHIESENLYVLEPENNRLVIITKAGDFVREVQSVSIASANGLLVNAEESKALIISGSLVFEVGL